MEETRCAYHCKSPSDRLRPPPGVEDRIREHAAELDRFFDQIMSCRVAVERQHRRHHQGNLFRVRLDITIPGHEIVVGRESRSGRAHQDISVAIRDAFDAARCQIEDHARIFQGEIKLHTVPDHGRIIRLFPKENFGFIATVGSGEVYFHRNSVAGGAFNKLTVWREVRFVAQHSESAKGLQASTISPIGKHNLPSAETVRV
jgi:cold shock CspA family protein/ribosome-associated translation inhibitor RaiA